MASQNKNFTRKELILLNKKHISKVVNTSMESMNKMTNSAEMRSNLTLILYDYFD